MSNRKEKRFLWATILIRSEIYFYSSAHTYTFSDGTGYFRRRMCRRKKYDVIACICFHKRKYSDFCPKVAKYIDKMCKGDKNCLYMNVKNDY